MTTRWRLDIDGTVQGVGFRPFVYHLAGQFGLSGWVSNNSHGVRVEVEGPPAAVEQFCHQLPRRLPPLARIDGLAATVIDCQNDNRFIIRTSEQFDHQSAQIAADSHVCDDCLAELFNPSDRRYRYPFINCTNCGPRYSLVTAIPYDRPQTTMAAFDLCPQCLTEYHDPASRRFHAQPNACADCGPQLQLLNHAGVAVPGDEPLAAAADLLHRGKIVAIKGVGGYHLAVDAANDEAVRRLRRRKQRDEKPLAVMVADVQRARQLVEVGTEEEQLLLSWRRPIVLLPKCADPAVAEAVAPGLNELGVMLPYTPLHYLLLAEGFDALVMTSGNRSDEPIAYEDEDAGRRLQNIADAFLVHNRPIHTRVDDSVVRLVEGQPQLLRRSRGYVPQAVSVAALPPSGPPVLALGGELKNTLCLLNGSQAVLSEHLGDLGEVRSVAAFDRARHHLQQLLRCQPRAVAHDLHPDYHTSRWARQQQLPTIAVQHHHAHLVSCQVDNDEKGPCLGVVFDGLGYGDDGRMWGGEFLFGDRHGYERLGYFDEVAMPGGDAASRQPYRMAISYLLASCGGQLPALPWLKQLPAAELAMLRQMVERGLNAPLTSSCGRLFDAVAALVGLRSHSRYEGQAAMELEGLAGEGGDDTLSYPFPLLEGRPFRCDWRPLIRAVVADVQAGESAGVISLRFHLALVDLVCRAVRTMNGQVDCRRVALCGGVFQNRLLLSRCRRQLGQQGFEVLCHRQVPTNDGGLALGQVAIAAAVLAEHERTLRNGCVMLDGIDLHQA